ncbi:MAG: CDP-alcohol phosphatidyltransferase family protein [Eubacteriales bacterium]|nr:CDP-alcohol phosphatidyltransferase family protein [Eubacteriales bacterium]
MEPNRSNENRFWTIPNVLTIFRFIMVGVMMYFFWKGNALMALAVYVTAALTDVLDGFIARKYHQISNFGKLFDPMADKVLSIAALCGLFFSGYIPKPLVIIVIVKESIMILGGAIILFWLKNVVSANKFGKFAAVMYTASILLTFLHQYIAPVDTVVLYIAVIVNIVALLQYAYLNIVQELKRRRKEAAAAGENPENAVPDDTQSDTKQ